MQGHVHVFPVFYFIIFISISLLFKFYFNSLMMSLCLCLKASIKITRVGCNLPCKWYISVVVELHLSSCPRNSFRLIVKSKNTLAMCTRKRLVQQQKILHIWHITAIDNILYNNTVVLHLDTYCICILLSWLRRCGLEEQICCLIFCCMLFVTL